MSDDKIEMLVTRNKRCFILVKKCVDVPALIEKKYTFLIISVLLIPYKIKTQFNLNQGFYCLFINCLLLLDLFI